MADSGDDVLRIRAAFDGSQLRTGLATGAADVDSSTQKMLEAFKKLDAESKAEIAQLTESVKQLKAEVADLTLKLEEAGSRTTKSMGNAQIAIRGAAQEMGITLPRAVSKYIASLQGVSAVASAAFSIVGIVGIAAVLPQIVDKIRDVIDAMFGWDEFAKKLHDKLVQQNSDLVVSMVKVREAYREVGTVGQQGVTKLLTTNKDLKAEVKDAADQMHLFQTTINGDLKKNIELTHGWQGAWTGLVGWIDGTDQQIKKNKQNVMDLGDEMDKLEGIIREATLQQAQNSAEITAQGIQDARQLSSAQIEATKKVADARIQLSTESAKRSYEESKITLEQEIQALTAAENKKFAILQASLSRQKALAATNPDAAAGASDTVRLNAELAAAATEHQNQLEAIATQGAQEQKRINQEVANAQIAVARQAAATEIQLAEATQRELFASHKISSAELTQELIADETKRTEAERKALQARLALAQQDSQKNKAQIITLNGELEDLEKQHEGRIAQIKAEGDRQQNEEAKRAMEEEVRAAEEAANKQLESITQLNALKLKANRETNREAADIDRAAVNQWYQSQAQALQRELAMARQTFGEQSTQYKSMLDKMNELDKQRQQKLAVIDAQEEAKQAQQLQKIFDVFNQNIIKMMNGQETFAKAFEKSWNNMISSMTLNLLKGLEQWAVSLITQKTAASESILISAKTAAGKAFASAPNPIIGAVEAAATFAGVMAYNSFDRGGIVPGDGFQKLHKNEMVLPAGLSTGIQSAIGRGQIGGNAQMSSPSRAAQSDATSGSTHPVHMTYSPTVNAYDRSGMKSTLKSHADDILDIVRSGYKAGKLS